MVGMAQMIMSTPSRAKVRTTSSCWEGSSAS